MRSRSAQILCPNLHHLRLDPLHLSSIYMTPKTPVAPEPVVEEGQFDDVPEDQSSTPLSNTVTPVDPREGHHFIDEELLQWSSESEGDEEDEFEVEEDNLEAEVFDTLRAEDEDWENAERGMSISSGYFCTKETNDPR